MYVGRIMRTNPITLPPDTSIVKARDIIAEEKIAHLLIVDDKDQLVGIVSDRDLKQSWASPATTLSAHELNYILKQLTLGVIMRTKIITVTPGTTIERAANIMQENRISALPVMEGKKLVGIITTTDVLEVLLRAIGTHEAGRTDPHGGSTRLGRGPPPAVDDRHLPLGRGHDPAVRVGAVDRAGPRRHRLVHRGYPNGGRPARLIAGAGKSRH